MLKRKRGKTVAEAMYDTPPAELVSLARTWCADASDIILASIWRGCDALQGNPKLRSVLAGTVTDDVERGLTRLLYFAIDDGLTRLEPFRLLHEAPEDESRKPAPARPRAYDIAFVYRENLRIMWPLEAKVLATDRTLADYVGTVRERYLSADYAPFTPEGGMLGYLLSGDAETAFTDIGKALDVVLAAPTRWTARRHRLSVHKRRVLRDKPYPTHFRCHHLLMSLE